MTRAVQHMTVWLLSKPGAGVVRWGVGSTVEVTCRYMLTSTIQVFGMLSNVIKLLFVMLGSLAEC